MFRMYILKVEDRRLDSCCGIGNDKFMLMEKQNWFGEFRVPHHPQLVDSD